MKCDLTTKKSMKGNKIGYVRKNVSKRTIRRFNPNLHETRFITKELGNFSLNIAANTKRSIDKYGGIVEFLLNIGENQLSELGLSLKNKIIKHNIKMNK
jgi:large subunit ribosomal protein L28